MVSKIGHDAGITFGLTGSGSHCCLDRRYNSLGENVKTFVYTAATVGTAQPIRTESAGGEITVSKLLQLQVHLVSWHSM